MVVTPNARWIPPKRHTSPPGPPQRPQGRSRGHLTSVGRVGIKLVCISTPGAPLEPGSRAALGRLGQRTRLCPP